MGSERSASRREGPTGQVMSVGMQGAMNILGTRGSRGQVYGGTANADTRGLAFYPTV